MEKKFEVSAASMMMNSGPVNTEATEEIEPVDATTMGNKMVRPLITSNINSTTIDLMTAYFLSPIKKQQRKMEKILYLHNLVKTKWTIILPNQKVIAWKERSGMYQ